jgi:Gpi18-like mannosyltransferase
MMFPGWETRITHLDGTKTTAAYVDDEQIQGRLAYRLEPGWYKVSTQFTQKTWARIVGNMVSGIALLALAITLFRKLLPTEISFFLTWKIAIAMIGISAPVFLFYDPSFPYSDSILRITGLPQSLYSWANFDGVHYLTIAEKGYVGTALIQAFFPLFPLLVRAVNTLIGNFIITGLFLNTLFSFLLLISFRKLLEIDYDKQTAWLGTLALFLFPTAFYFQAFYTESLFLWLVISSFYFARKRKWWLASLFIGLASATRIVGILLVPAILIELFSQYESKTFRLWWKHSLAILLGGIGFLSYALYLWKEFGHPLFFMQVQSEFGSGRQETVVLFPQVVWRYIKILKTYRPFGLMYVTFVQEFVVAILGLLALMRSWFTVRKSYVVFSTLAFLVPTITGNFSSMPRYVLTSFALFVLVGQILNKSKLAQVIYFTLSTLLLVFNTILFIQGYWVA